MAHAVRSAGPTQLVNAATSRHHLHSPAAPGSASVLQVAADTVGLHSTLPGTPYLSLHARIGDFKATELDTETYEHRSLVPLRAVRGTVFLLTHDLAPIAFAATREVFRDRDRTSLRIDPAVYRRLAPLVLDALGEESLTTAELRTRLMAMAGWTRSEMLIRYTPRPRFRTYRRRSLETQPRRPLIRATSPSDDAELRSPTR